MRRLAFFFVMAAALLLASAGVAAVTGINFWATHAGITCGFGTGPQGKGVACIQTTQKGYAVTLTHTKVIVWLNGKRVFSRSQP